MCSKKISNAAKISIFDWIFLKWNILPIPPNNDENSFENTFISVYSNQIEKKIKNIMENGKKKCIKANGVFNDLQQK